MTDSSATRPQCPGASFSRHQGRSVDPGLALDAQDDGLARGPAPTFAFDVPFAEVGFVDFDEAGEGRLGLTVLGQSLPDFEEDGVHRAHRKAREAGGIGGREIKRETAFERR